MVNMTDLNALAEKLIEQPWNDIGNGVGELGATDNFDLMIDQLAAVLGVRLKELVASRRLSALTYLEDKGNLKSNVRLNLHDYVACIARMYRKVHYHSLEHATHVTLSANKLLGMLLKQQDMDEGSSNEGDGSRQNKRRVTLTHVPEQGVSLDNSHDANKEADWVREATFGISADPMLRFALIFSCLVHDVDHQGVPNSTLVEEEDELAIIHNDASVAEQNSLQVAFTLLSRKEFDVLRRAIMPDKMEKKKFRKLIIDIVLSTDISNPERMQISQSKWMEAFGEEEEEDEEDLNDDSFLGDSFSDTIGELGTMTKKRHIHKRDMMGMVNKQRNSMFAGVMPLRRTQSERLGIRMSLDFGGQVLDAYSSTSEGEMRLRQDTILDTLMNAADVAHTMQSFDVFVKWNKRLFQELHAASQAKRISWNPAEGWYGNQIWFYDAYVIPLAEKMAKCGIFGSRSTVFLCFAMENKRRWEAEGVDITEKMTGEIDQGISLQGISQSSEAPS